MLLVGVRVCKLLNLFYLVKEIGFFFIELIENSSIGHRYFLQHLRIRFQTFPRKRSLRSLTQTHTHTHTNVSMVD